MKLLAEDRYDFLWQMMADKKLSAPAKCAGTVLLLQYRNNRTGQCNPSFASLGRAMGRDRSNAVDAVRDLAKHNWLKVISTLGGSKRNTNQFDFNFERMPSPSDASPGASSPQGESTPGVKTPFTQGDFTTRTTKEPLAPSAREWVRDSPPQRAPDGALEDFEELCQLWRRPHGTNETKARAAFLKVTVHFSAVDIIASARRWVAAREPNYLPKLEQWLTDGAWQNEPPVRRRNNTKSTAAEVAAKLARGEAW